LKAYERKTVHDIFLRTLNWLEKYIEIAGYYPDWESRKQLRNDWIKKAGVDTSEKAEKEVSNRLIAFGRILDSEVESDSPFIEELKNEFYQWVNATGIDVDNCPERLKQFIFGFNEMLEGRLEKIEKDAENKKEKIDTDAPEYLKQLTEVLVNIQEPLKNERETEASLQGKTHLDIEIENKVGGNVEQGEKAFKRIASTVSASHDTGFHFFPQQQIQQLNSHQQRTNSEIIQDIRQNPRNWRIDDVIIDLGENRQENVLIHQSTNLDDYDQQTGKLNFDGNAIYRANRFSAEEQVQINQALNISVQVEQAPPYKQS